MCKENTKDKSNNNNQDDDNQGIVDKTINKISAIVGGAGVAGTSGVAAVNAVGFTQAGITGGSLAASLMSSAAVANGGGIAAGSMVAIGQHLGTVLTFSSPFTALVVGTAIYKRKDISEIWKYICSKKKPKL